MAEHHPDRRSEQAARRPCANYPDAGSYLIIRCPAHHVERRHIEGRTLSVVDCDYLPQPEPIQFPLELALLIVRKAAAMAEAFESKALDQMAMDASRALRDGMEPRRIIRQMGL